MEAEPIIIENIEFNSSSCVQQNSFKYIHELTCSERQEFLNSFDIVFCDCDGVIWQDLRNVITGAPEALVYLAKQGKKIAYVTNNSISSIQEQLLKFERCNVNLEKRDIVHPAQTVCDYLQSIKFDGLIFCLATKYFKNLLREAGFQLVEEIDRIIPESVHELRAAIYSDAPVKAVIIDVDFNLTAAKLMRAHVHLKNPECLFIGGAADTLIPFGGGDIIGPGPFINVVEQATKRKAITLGKPGKQLCEVLMQRYAICDTRRVLFIGDSLTSDVKFGKMCGFQTLVVLTGGTKAQDLLAKDLDATETPDFVATRLGDLNELL